MSKTTTTDAPKMAYSDMTIVRDGKQIILPVGMSYAEGRVWLTRQEEAEMKTVAVYADIPCFPLDGLVALATALKEIYGFTGLSGDNGFFGETPPCLVQVDTPKGIVTAPIGRLSPPKFEGGFLETNPGKMSLIISGEIRKKFEPEVKEVIEKTKQVLAERSIYRGQAFILDLNYLNTGEKFHPINHAPKFMDVSNVDENGVLLSRAIMKQIAATVYVRIEQSEFVQKNGTPLRHGALFAGKFGTGKTLTSRVIASKCVRNEWTFIYLKTTNQIATALKLAEMYAPAVLFAEDIDSVTSGQRDADLNTILNTLDGVDTKDKPIITILTTNYVEKIEKAMLRPGRIDTLVEFTYPDAETAFKFVELYAKDDDGKSLLAPVSDEERERVGQALAGKIPAFIAEAVQKAKLLAILKHGGDIQGKLTSEDIVDAATGQKAQEDRLNGTPMATDEEKSHIALQHMGAVIIDNYRPMPDMPSLCRNGK